MQYKRLTVAILTAGVLFTVAGCSSNQAVKTTDGKTIVTDGKPQVDDDTGLVSYKNAETGQTEQINRDQVKSMGELDN
ncbi:YgdI/YgdR family lipoprotein [Kluyvera intermedia]|uniref:YgdI/YgdR family lipoprotein n=1 Tax=Kluyvera intermedia TaxID=61648 RepID=A0A5Q2U478_KLUIN|nr:YgdI/YgdR family lipoprotein [Kluyvera intermedia]QGH32300.1 YgdI/YgdR family lipoprotein [Kluyvera intermedia]QGH41282.1 YgdI/YgdR family lipoprotein [Kluyvera intermedia]WEJ86632.1 MAG: YgdI/YgdR family lipoprotein [Kluyvera intermedia]WGL58436.1 YgdI/YgdR family lipoprotein [Kluyvera intermedia]WQD31955.1 YgdI/YgdR family lipoprotein [Kluyvera intermedia]